MSTASLQKGKTTTPNKCPGYDTKLSDVASGNVEYPFIAVSHTSRAVVPVWVPSMGQIELFNYLTVCKQMTDVKLNYQK